MARGTRAVPKPRVVPDLADWVGDTAGWQLALLRWEIASRFLQLIKDWDENTG